ncbi:MAG: class II fructose-bisphosphate aldolase [Candidatus Shapirobacteria bacterium]|nr:class II fructose-bisphosphate aldolase [Candidatus Shapirobacteria bacterium]MDD3003117.1 class II fructose-bisphosphate aldolase [Candidatus Shapirobacteria bacterium]MDD4383026.1 class II fructose-bisphosphate aldolase [Candidatus Shapirobacteria bacterium]
MKTLRQLLTEYRATGKAIPAFNIDTFEIYQAVEDSVKETGLPCIVQLSTGEDKFIQAERLFVLVKKAQLDGLPIYLNMDHASDQIRLEKLISLGFDMVHFDGSKMDYSTNLETSQKFIHILKNHYPHTLFEVEFNHINLVDTEVSKNSFTDPNQAYEFMTQTSADLLAVSIGNLHGVSLKLPETIDLNLLTKIKNKIPEDRFITLHGGSGISPDQITQAIQLGVVKININTELRIAFNQSLAKIYSKEVSQKIYDNFSPAIDELKNIIKSKLLLFSTSKYA